MPVSKEAIEIEIILKKHMGMYDWTTSETKAILDFILTVREGLAEELQIKK